MPRLPWVIFPRRFHLLACSGRSRPRVSKRTIRRLQGEVLEVRRALDAAPVYLQVDVEALAQVTGVMETDRDRGQPAHQGAPLSSSYDLSASSNAAAGDASASAQSSAMVTPASVVASGVAEVQPGDSGALANASLTGDIFVAAELGSMYQVTLTSSGDCFAPGTMDPLPAMLQGTVPDSGFTEDMPPAGSNRSWVFTELPGETSPPKLAYRAGAFIGGTGFIAGPGDKSVPYSCSVSAVAEHTPPPAGDIVAVAAERLCPDGSCFSLTYRVEENPVSPFRIGLYAFTDTEVVRLTTGVTGDYGPGIIDYWVAGPWLRTVGEHTVRIDLHESVDLILPPGTRFLFFEVNDLGGVEELDDKNNVVVMAPNINMLSARLALSSVVEFTARIEGTLDQFAVGLYLSPDPLLLPGDPGVAPLAEPKEFRLLDNQFAEGPDLTFHYFLDEQLRLPLDTPFLLVVADPLDVIPETEELDNVVSVGPSVSGQKFHDFNGNGVNDDGQPGLDGWTIELLDDQGQVVATTVTQNIDVNEDGVIDPLTEQGLYRLEIPDLGTYEVRERPQEGWVQTFPKDPETHTVTIPSNEEIPDLDFGNFQLVTLSGQKFNDLNGDGVKDDGEPGLQGWTIRLDLNRTVVTDAEGNYRFEEVGPGRHTIREVFQEHWVQSFPADPGTHTITVTSGRDAGDMDFGNQQADIEMISARLALSTVVEFTARIRGDLARFEVALFRSPDPFLSPSDPRVELVAGPTTFQLLDQEVGSGSELAFSFFLGEQLRLPRDTPFLLVVADPLDDIPEANETDNIQFIGFAPDWDFVDFVIPTDNYSRNANGSSRRESFNQIVIHATAGNEIDSIDTLTDTTDADRPSAHYLITQTGQITQFVQEFHVANHAGNPGAGDPGAPARSATNRNSIGIELVDDGNHRTDVSWPTGIQLARAAFLVRNIAERHGLDTKPEGNRFVLHPAIVPYDVFTDPDEQDETGFEDGFRAVGTDFVDPSDNVRLGPFEFVGTFLPGTSAQPGGTVSLFADGYGPTERGVIGHGQVQDRTGGKDDPQEFQWDRFMNRVNRGIVYSLHSQADLLVIDPSGNRTGIDPDTGETLLEIPGSEHSGPGAEPQFVSIPFAADGEYTIHVMGTGLGPFRLEVMAADEEGKLRTAERNGPIAPGATGTYVATYASMGDFSLAQIVAALPWHNADLPADVNGSGNATITDLLVVVGYLRENGSVALPPVQGPPVPGYVDVNPDGQATIADLLALIAHLRETLSAATGESEGTQFDRAVAAIDGVYARDADELFSVLTCEFFDVLVEET